MVFGTRLMGENSETRIRIKGRLQAGRAALEEHRISQICRLRWQNARLFSARYHSQLAASLLAGTLAMVAQGVISAPAQAAQLNRFCQVPQADADQKAALRVAGSQGDATAQSQYEAMSQQHAQEVQNCRKSQWPKNQGVWLRLYPCDLQPGRLDEVMDRIVNLGYNQVYIEAFSNGQVLLPKDNNPTVWPSVVQASEYADRDLLAEAIAEAKERNISPQAWLFTMNFGYSYGQRSDRRQVLARNGQGRRHLRSLRFW